MLNILALPSLVAPTTIYGRSRDASSTQISALLVIVLPSSKVTP